LLFSVVNDILYVIASGKPGSEMGRLPECRERTDPGARTPTSGIALEYAVYRAAVSVAEPGLTASDETQIS